MAAIRAAGYKPGKDIYLALDVAATEFFENGRYVLKGERQDARPATSMVAYLRASSSRTTRSSPSRTA